MTATVSVSNLAPASVIDFNAEPINYGVNHLYWNMPSPTFPWTSCKVTRKFGGHPTVSDPGETVAEFESNSLFLGVNTATSTTGGFVASSFTGGGSVQIGTNAGLIVDGRITGTNPEALYNDSWTTFTSGTTSKNISFTGGGVATIGAAVGNISTYSMVTGTDNWAVPVYAEVTASGGSGSGAKFRVSTGPTFIPNFGYTLTVTLINPGTGYTVGNTISLSVPATGGPIPFSFTVTSVVPQSTVKYYWPVTQTSTSGNGSGAKFIVLRSGTSGSPLNVTGVVVLEGGLKYAVGDTVTIAGSSIGSSTNLTLTIKNVTSPTTTPYAVTKIYSNVSGTVDTGSGSGAKFDVYRVGLTDSLVPVTSVVVKSAGSGYSNGNTITISAADIGTSTAGASNLVITCTTVAGSAAGNITNIKFGTALDAETWWQAELPAGGTLASDASVVYTNVPATTAFYKGGSSGTGATFDITRDSNGIVTSVAINNPGTGYTAKDLLVVPSTAIGWNTIQTPSFGNTSDFHSYDLGQYFSEEEPGPFFTSTWHQGKEVYYSVILTYPYESAASGTPYKDKQSVVIEDSVISIEEQGTLDWLLNHLPIVYSTIDTNEDLKDFLSLFAFHIDLIKTYNNMIFNKYKISETPEVLVKLLLKQFGEDYNNLQNLGFARRVVSNLIKSYSQKGSVDGIYTLLRSYAKLNDGLTTNDLGDIYVSRNKLLDVNSCDFQSGTGFWRPGLSSTVSTSSGNTVTFGIGVPIRTVGYDSGQSLVGEVELLNTAGTNPSSLAMSLGPKKTTVTSSSTTTIDGVTYDTVVVAFNSSVVTVGDYVFMSGTDKILPGTKVLSNSGGTVVLDTRLASGLSAGDVIYFSPIATDVVGALSEYIPVQQNFPYRFRLSTKKYVAGITTTLAVGIIWRDASGAALNYVVSSAATVTTSYAQVSVMGTAPSGAVYAEPYLRATFSGTPIADHCVLIKNCALWSPEKVTSASRTSNVATLVYKHIGTVPSVGDSIIVAGMGSDFDTTSATVASVSSTAIGTTNYNTVTITYSNTGSNTTLTNPLGVILADISSTITVDKYPGYYDVVTDINQSTRDEDAEISRLKEVVRDHSPLGRSGVLSLNSVATSKAVGVTVTRDSGSVFQVTYTVPANTTIKVGHKVTVVGSYSASLVCQNETVVGTPTPTTFVIEKTSGTPASTTAAGTATFTPLLSGLVAVTPHTTTAYEV